MNHFLRFTLLALLIITVASCSATVSPAPAQEPPITGEEADTTTEDAPSEVVNMVEVEEETSDEAPFALSPDQISLNTQGLSDSWQPMVVPGTAYDESMPPGPAGLPTHIEFFIDGSDVSARQPGDPIMYIIPVNSYRKLWNDAGNPGVTETIAKIDQLAATMVNPTSGVPVLPFEQTIGYNDLAVQFGRAMPAGQVNTTSATQDGYRFVGRWAQDANPATNENLRYVYQGFTNDGVYLVSFWWPVSTSQLPADASGLSSEQWDAFNADPQAAIIGAAETLNALSTDQWEPDLETLDTLVASLQIDGIVAAGLLGTTWEWESGPVVPGSSEIATTADPSQYQATYGSDGVLTLVADCNTGSMGYELRDTGSNGGMLADNTATVTLAECSEESLSQGFIYSLQAAQSYRVHAGGNSMDLVLPAGGGTLLMRAGDPPSPEDESNACITGMVTFTEDVTLSEDTFAQISLLDTSLMDAPAKEIGVLVIANPETFPIPYEVCYDPSLIRENHTYTMQARIENSAGSLLYINDTAIPVITRGNPTDQVEIPVILVGE